MKVPLAIAQYSVSLLLVCTLAAAEEPAPAWIARAGTLRASDPAVAKGRDNVEWRTWNAETFAEAERTQKPVYVFVTANWCRGGREMERVVLADPAVAKALNANFIPVRLDRDALPETDLRLQQAASALKSVRGWPLNVFLTPDGGIFYAATSLALDDDIEFNRPGMKLTLEGVLYRWQNDHFRITRDAETFCRVLRKHTEGKSFRAAIPPDILNVTALFLQKQFDRENGGFLSPLPAQFPEPRALEVCLAHYARTGDKNSLAVVETTLDRMLRGGIYDRIEGGFHRFSNDRKWLMPRFEKMPIMNAEMIEILLHTWQATGNGRYRTAAEECLDFWNKELDAAGMFFPASIAPDSHSFEEGTYYTWSLREIEALFPDDTGLRLAKFIYGIGEIGNQPYTAPDRTVLTAARSLYDAARETGLTLDAARQRAERINAHMRAARTERPHPPRDAAPLCDANAMLAAAFIEGGRLLGRSELTKQGLKTLNAILRERVNGLDDPRPPRHILNDSKSIPLAMDEAARAWACLQAYETTAEPRYKQLAAEALDRLDENYRDLLFGGYIERSFHAPPDFAAPMNWRTKSFQDTSDPSTNGLIASALAKLSALTGDAQYMERAKAAVEAVALPLAKPSPYNGTLTLAADAVQNGVVSVKIIGSEKNAAVASMLSLANARYFPWKIVMRFDSVEEAGELPIAKMLGKKPNAIVESRDGKRAVETIEELNKILDELQSPARE